MSGRTLLLDVLDNALPAETWAVIRTGVRPDQISRNVAISYTDRLARATQASLEVITETLTCLVLVRETRPDQIDDALDAAILEVVEAIEGQDALRWETADRTAIDDKFEGWTLSITATYTITRED